ncbi:MAG TPA: hypothetical protein PLZ58_01165 [Candidatus Saccharibacteria bacterium]|nr:hypothetical protein [Candidatus Saccharibacteria bacterium]HRQ07069.1 hypothetical protein [Candidatus Saccharibacteria bacterium]
MSSLIIMGPTDITKVSRFASISNYTEWLKGLAAVCADSFDELYFIPDHGVYVDFAMEYLNIKGTNSVVAVMPHGEKWLVERAKSMGITKFHEMQEGVGWSFLNTHFVSLAPYALFLGYSSGSLLELTAAKYIRVFEGHTTVFFVDERSISSKLPLEILEDIQHVHYFKSEIQLKKAIQQYVKK